MLSFREAYKSAFEKIAPFGETLEALRRKMNEQQKLTSLKRGKHTFNTVLKYSVTAAAGFILLFGSAMLLPKVFTNAPNAEVSLDYTEENMTCAEICGSAEDIAASSASIAELLGVSSAEEIAVEYKNNSSLENTKKLKENVFALLNTEYVVVETSKIDGARQVLLIKTENTEIKLLASDNEVFVEAENGSVFKLLISVSEMEQIIFTD